MKAVHLLINSYLPDDLKSENRTYTVKELNELMHQIATRYPDQFDNVLRKISNAGRRASYLQGETITLQDLAAPFDKKALFAQMDDEIKALPKDKDFKQNRRAIYQKYNQLMEKLTSENALKNRNNISMSVLSGARGKSAQLKAMITSPGTYSDYKGNPIDVFSKESFAEGITPATFAASSFGTRSSVISTKCLDYQSLVKMADLSEKKLCDIKVGDMVLGADKEGKVFPVKVLNVFDQGEKECYKYTFRSSILEPDSKEPIGTVICTKDHKFLNAEQGCSLPIKEAHKSNYMRPGVKWKLSDGSVAVATEAEPIGKVHCMDIEVDHPDHLFVLANGLITSNSSTAKGGDWAKQMAQVAADMVIRKEDCGTHNGLVLDIDDKSLKGRVLARETAGFKPGTLITRDVLAKMRKEKVKEVEARSPLTCGVHNGLCSKCVGRFYNGGKWAKVGQHVGTEASSVTGEPITQMALCIAGYEFVTKPDGSVVRIRDIEVGQEVRAADKHGHITTAKVLNVFDQGIKQVRTFTFEFIINYGRPILHDDGTMSYAPTTYGQATVTCTEDHKFLYADGTVAPIKDIYESGKLNKILLMEDRRLAALIEISEPREEHCYDIEIDHPDHLFMLATGFICSNSAKHTAGMTQAKKTYSGLGIIQQFTQSPEKFKDEGTVATVDGKVEKIEEAPQGGMYVTIKGKKHYILPGHEVEVKEGQELEAGDQLAEGLVDPEDIVKYKGLGEGRKYWAERLGKILEDSGTPSDKRNLEVLARAAIRHVRVTNQDGMGDYLPDDVIDYNALQDSYRPDEETTRQVRPKDAVGKYLQVPVLHYTIGTRITPKVAKFMQEHGHDKISVEDKAPSFVPEMIRLRTASHSNPDWMASMGTSYLTKQLNEAATEGDDTNVRQNADWRPRLAFGAGFGKTIATTGEF